MNDLYAFGVVYSFQGVIHPILGYELKNCKTQKEGDEVTEACQTITPFGSIVAFILGVLVCGVISLFT